MKPSKSIMCALALSSAMLHEGAAADEGDALNFSVSQSIRYESNLFRLDDGERAPENKAHDTVSETGVGMKFDRRYGRQRFLADLNLVSARYAIHNDLDHDRPDAGLAWDWQLGDRWSGELGHAYRETLTPFDEAGGTERNMNAYTRSHVSADFWWHPRWAVGAGFAHARSRFDRDDADLAEFDADTVDLNLTYRPPTGNRAVLTLRDTDGEYVNRPAVPGSIRDYRQQEVRLGGEWRLSGATRVSGFIGRTRVEYRLAPERDFRGTVGRVGLVWDTTAKTSVDLSVRREIGAQQDLVANYAVTEAVRLAPKWNVTEKVSLGAGLEWRRRDYRGDPELVRTGGAREKPTDSSYRYGLHAEYRPQRALSFAFSVQRQERDGSRSLGGYSANTADLSMRFRF
ncbi:outer membrane beta-barrel protein [Aromatoleum toluclasticum]|uniref:XrtB/PEP-CTERM-associated polysaccharide biosynthesis outer membrane protein EpsL n=1 Tax=Aromatoleum toluclasticum TaxID=92003 RepID=UPI001D17D469|nr:XrtB/PEP-CTERM-associated polysaccharide biosynthesis outer membrane protein EpsL [Aromatoleum toluclasticum]MCC4116423.1 outer membrane beta-barrel protein [Aromatoleum toluclasticum]